MVCRAASNKQFYGTAACYEISICRATKHEPQTTRKQCSCATRQRARRTGVPHLKLVGLSGKEHEVAGVHKPSSWFTWQRARSSWCT
jgi:hypothetical protein